MAVPQGETTPKLLRSNVCSVLNSDILINSADQSPELFLHKLSRNHLKWTKQWFDCPLPQHKSIDQNEFHSKVHLSAKKSDFKNFTVAPVTMCLSCQTSSRMDKNTNVCERKPKCSFVVDHSHKTVKKVQDFVSSAILQKILPQGPSQLTLPAGNVEGRKMKALLRQKVKSLHLNRYLIMKYKNNNNACYKG